MNKTRIRYFEQEDVLHLAITDEPESRSLELSPDITAELNDKDKMIGVEILNASKFFAMRYSNPFRRRLSMFWKQKPLNLCPITYHLSKSRNSYLVPKNKVETI